MLQEAILDSFRITLNENAEGLFGGIENLIY